VSYSGSQSIDMKKPTFPYFALVLAFIFALRFASPVFAHGDEPRVEISVDRMNPGGVIEVRGVDFEFEELVSLALIGPGVEIPLGQVSADAEGVFSQIITLPTDLMEGAYQFLAVSDDHRILSPALLIQGISILNDGSEGQRAEEESLLVPMPTFAPGIVPESVSRTATPPAPSGVLTLDRNSTGFIWLTLLSVGIIVVLGLSVARKNK